MKQFFLLFCHRWCSTFACVWVTIASEKWWSAVLKTVLFIYLKEL